MNDRKFVCQYAEVRFAPYRMTGEFVNAGVVLLCAEAAFFDFRLQHGEPRRVTEFFPELPIHVYWQSMHTLRGELELVQRVFRAGPKKSPELAVSMKAVFENLVLEREAMVRFGAVRAVKTDDPARELGRQYNLLVDRSYEEPGMVPYLLE